LSLWIAFGILVTLALVFDLGVLNRSKHELTFKEAGFYSLFWISLALLFAIGIWKFVDAPSALTFTSAYLVELSLSVDNLFVFLILFKYFKVPADLRRTVLLWGILGALVCRGIFIFAGISLIHRFEWLLYVLGAFLVYIGVKLIMKPDQEVHPERNPFLRFAKQFMPITNDFRGSHFFVRENGRLHMTPLFVVVLGVETTDVIFAVDSIPAVLAISLDTFIVFTSNIFAILGLRSLFFVLARLMPLFQYLQYGVSAILVLVGIKMLISSYLEIPPSWTLGLTFSLLFISVFFSIIRPKSVTDFDENLQD
jgi:tellurite resistance protein TerC